MNISFSEEDYIKYFKRTYISLELKEEKPSLVEFIEKRNGKFIFCSPETGNILLNPKEAMEITKPFFPETGLYNIFDAATLFIKLPARQFKRAPCYENCLILDILQELNLPNKEYNRINLEFLNEILKNIYPKNLIEAIKTIKQTKALSKTFAISQTYTDNPNEFILWYRTIPIGLINSKEQAIHIKYEPLFQEVLDYFVKKEPEWLISLK